MAESDQLADLYDRIGDLLVARAAVYPRHEEPTWSDLLGSIEAAAAILRARARAQPPLEVSAAERAQLDALRENAVFVVGYYKSGTTLLLQLLDDHPDVVVLPSESRHFPGFAAKYGSLDRTEQIGALQAEWVRRLISPTGLPPFWALGEPSADDDPYERFSRALVALDRGDGDLLGLVPQAVVASLRPAVTPRLWVEKTPTHEFQLEPILAAYPRARFVHILRDPSSTLASLKGFGSERPVADPLEAAAELARSFDCALDGPARLGADRYLVLRYEDLVENPEREMRAVADLLEIPFRPALLAPTSGGRPATANAGRAERRTSGTIHRLSLSDAARLDRRSSALVAALAGPQARELGYAVPRGNAVVRAVARIALRRRYGRG